MEKEYEIVAEFKKGNCKFIIEQPVQKMTDEEIKELYKKVSAIIYG